MVNQDSIKRTITIAGAGVGGLSLGIRLLQLGITPLIIEKQNGLRPQIKGEYIQPQGVAILRDMGLLETLLDGKTEIISHFSHHFKDPILGLHRHFPFSYNLYDGIDYGLAILHEDFLAALRQEYARLGGELWEGVWITDLYSNNDGYSLWLSDGRLIETNGFVGSDGRSSPTRKLAGLKTQEFNCDRIMCVAFVKGLHVPKGEFYTEALDSSLLYAFSYPNGFVRIYVCIDKADLKKASLDKKSFILKSVKASRLKYFGDLEIVGAVHFMPSADVMVEHPVKGHGIWIGDAHGSVDPLGGQGMSIALSSAFRLANHLQDWQLGKVSLPMALEASAHECKAEYLHARTVALWIGRLFMGHSMWVRWIKQAAITRYAFDSRARDLMVNLFAGMTERDLGIIDLPYLLGVLPERVRRIILKSSLHQRTLGFQKAVFQSPRPLRELRKKLINR